MGQTQVKTENPEPSETVPQSESLQINAETTTLRLPSVQLKTDKPSPVSNASEKSIDDMWKITPRNTEILGQDLSTEEAGTYKELHKTSHSTKEEPRSVRPRIKYHTSQSVPNEDSESIKMSEENSAESKEARSNSLLKLRLQIEERREKLRKMHSSQRKDLASTSATSSGSRTGNSRIVRSESETRPRVLVVPVTSPIQRKDPPRREKKPEPIKAYEQLRTSLRRSIEESRPVLSLEHGTRPQALVTPRRLIATEKSEPNARNTSMTITSNSNKVQFVDEEINELCDRKTEVRLSSDVFEVKLELEGTDQIENVLAELDGIKRQVEGFKGTKGNKQYEYLEKKLNFCMTKLDSVETNDKADIRQKRKSAAKEITSTISLLRSKACV